VTRRGPAGLEHRGGRVGHLRHRVREHGAGGTPLPDRTRAGSPPLCAGRLRRRRTGGRGARGATARHASGDHPPGIGAGLGPRTPGRSGGLRLRPFADRRTAEPELGRGRAALRADGRPRPRDGSGDGDARVIGAGRAARGDALHRAVSRHRGTAPGPADRRWTAQSSDRDRTIYTTYTNDTTYTITNNSEKD